MRPIRTRAAALFFAVLLALTGLVLPLPARAADLADTITVDGRTFQDGLGNRADLAGAKGALLAAVKSRTAAVDLTAYGLGTAQLSQVYDQVFFENPSLFYLENGYAYATRQTRAHPEALVVSVVQPSYYAQLSAKDAPRYEAAVKEALAVLRPGMTDFDKALALHDYLAAHCAYDDSLANYSPYHALVTGSAVCQGYLLAYSDLLNRAGVTNYPCISVSQNHGWNAVKLGGSWYHVDVTWDRVANLPEGWVLHTNFLRSDQGIRTTGALHRNWTAPAACTDTKYETSFLPSLRAPVVYPPQGGAYFLLNGKLCASADLSTLQYRVVSDSGSGRGGTAYSPQDARLIYWDGSLYYTDAVNVYRYDLTTGETNLQGTYTGGGGFLSTLSVSGSGASALLTAQVRAYPSGAVQDRFTVKPTLSAATAHSLVCPARGYADVSPSQWYHEAVDYVLERRMMQGVSSTAFAPDGTTTRAMIVTILYRLEGSPAAGPASFSDVAANAWYAAPVRWAASHGIVSGVSATAFSPDAPITREQLAAILSRYAAWKGLDVTGGKDLSAYRDAGDISPYARTSLAWANAAGLITGRDKTTLAPRGTATRAEAATILMRLSKLLPAA